MASERYNVVLHRVGGGLTLLEHRGRVAWTLKTARKHGLEMQAKINTRELPYYRAYKAVELSPADHAGPCVPLGV